MANDNRSLAIRLDEEATRRERAGEDTLIPGCLAPGGMRDVLENNPELQKAIKRGNIGIVYVDLRGQKVLNDEHDRETGDLHIKASHDAVDDAATEIENELTMENELTQALAEIIRQPLRTPDAKPGVERRQSSHPRLDMLVRIGGDEFAILLSDISPENLTRFAGALQERFSVEQAIQNYHNDPPLLPLIASVGSSHLSSNEHARQAVENGDYWTMYRLMCHQADEQHGRMKKLQYQQMWDASLANMSNMQREILKMPDDLRQIHKLFLETRCPEFFRNPSRYMIPRLRSH